MDKSKVCILSFTSLMFILGASSSALNNFGSLTGKATIEPALKVTELKSELQDNETAEKIEIYNSSPISVDLTSYTISDGANNTLNAVNQTDIPSKTHAVLIPDSYDGKYRKNVYYFRAGSAFSLANSGDIASIWSGDKSLIDYVSYSESCGEIETLQRKSLTSNSFVCTEETLGSGEYQ